jgi:hypothetical protein
VVVPHGGELGRAQFAFIWQRGQASLWVTVGKDLPWDANFQVYVLLNHASSQQEGFFKAPLVDWRFGEPLRLFVDFWPDSRTLQVADAFRVPLLTLPLDVAGALGGPAQPGLFGPYMAADHDVLSWQADDDRRDRTTVSMSVTPATSGADDPVTVRATVDDPDVPGATPTGTVQVYDDTTPLGAPVKLDASGAATITMPIHAAGAHRLRATYRSDSVAFSDGGAMTMHDVRADETETQLVVAPAQPRLGDSVSLTARVLDRRSPDTKATGSVQIELDGHDLGAPLVLDPAGEAHASLGTLALGRHELRGMYRPDGSQLATSSGLLTVDVLRHEARIVASAVPDPSVAGQDVTFTATVSAVDPGVLQPSGTVEFKEDDGTIFGGPERIDAHGEVATVAAADAGRYRVHVVYGGDAMFAPAEAVIDQTVARAATRTSLTSEPNPVTTGETLRVDVDVAVLAPGDAELDGYLHLGGNNTAPSSDSLVQTVIASAQAPRPPVVTPPPTPTPLAPTPSAHSTSAPKALANLATAIRRRLRRSGVVGLSGFTVRFDAPSAGRVDTRLADRSGTVLARGSLAVTAARGASVKVRLTSAGRRAAGRRNALKLTLRSRFQPLTGLAVSRADRFTAPGRRPAVAVGYEAARRARWTADVPRTASWNAGVKRR